jgi:hypothetical protein
MLILAIVHTSKRNALILAVSMPMFSLMISGHPVFPKMILIMCELTMNVFLFYAFTKRVNNIFLAVLSSIIISKAMYYLLKFVFISFAIINTDLISTPILVQVVTTVIFSMYLFLFYRKD